MITIILFEQKQYNKQTKLKSYSIFCPIQRSFSVIIAACVVVEIFFFAGSRNHLQNVCMWVSVCVYVCAKEWCCCCWLSYKMKFSSSFESKMPLAKLALFREKINRNIKIKTQTFHVSFRRNSLVCIFVPVKEIGKKNFDAR